MSTVYEVYRYAADGCAGEVDPISPERSDGAVLATGSLAECQAAVRKALGARMRDKVLTAAGFAARRWPGTDGDVEAYHESWANGCGGWAIRRRA